MAEQNVMPVPRADEIAALRQQLEEMQKRLEELSAADAKVEDTSSAALVSETKEASLQSENNEAEICAGAVEAQQAPQAQTQSTAQEQAQPAGAGAQAQAQQAPQAQNPYGETHAGQQVPFGQTDPQQQHYQQTQQTYYGYGVQQNAYQAPLARSKDHVAAALLGIFLGVFGIHKFYLGYHTAGFTMLGVSFLGGIITFGLAACAMWLIGVIEGVIYLVKDQAEFEQVYVSSKREWF